MLETRSCPFLQQPRTNCCKRGLKSVATEFEKVHVLDSHLSALPAPWWALHFKFVGQHLSFLVVLICQMWPPAYSVLYCLACRGVGTGMASSPASSSPSSDLMHWLPSVGWEYNLTSVGYKLDKSWSSFWTFHGNRKTEVGKDLWRSQVQLLLKLGPVSQLGHVAQGLIQSSFENFQQWRYHSLSKPLLQLTNFHSR